MDEFVYQSYTCYAYFDKQGTTYFECGADSMCYSTRIKKITVEVKATS